ncbi:MAG: PIG-L family deacetylase [Bacteroidales bacterium]|nr:PIG-L family deacetylase [Bacteroidales bacterium]
MSKKVLAVSVHPDDETLGCGGTLLKHKANGDKIFCVYITNGNAFQAKTINELNKLYEFENTFQLGLPELELDDISLNHIIPKISEVIKEVEPEVLYIPNRSDVHSDHRRVFEALVAVTKSFRYDSIKKILMCEVMSETDFSPALIENVFQPNVFNDISEYFDKKIEILKIFKSELFEAPYTRSIDSVTAHNRYRGSQINTYYAESFMLIKEIN